MATRSRIAIEREGGGVWSIYCHWDGYPEHNGRVLRDHYQDREKVEQLIALGDISILREKVEPEGEHTFDNPEPGVVVAYHRDRGESLQRATYHDGRRDYFSGNVEEYGYLFTNQNEWFYVTNVSRSPKKCSKI